MSGLGPGHLGSASDATKVQIDDHLWSYSARNPVAHLVAKPEGDYAVVRIFVKVYVGGLSHWDRCGLVPPNYNVCCDDNLLPRLGVDWQVLAAVPEPTVCPVDSSEGA